MKTFFTRILVWAVIVMPQFAQAQTIFGITADKKLVSFAATAPATILTNVNITGVAAAETLVGFDTRPATGELFALGYNATTDSATLYVINPTTGAAAAKLPSIKLTGLGVNAAMDFNPTVDRIRLIGKTGKNFRLNPNNGAIAATDGDLKYATTDVNAGKTPAVTACAYTNSYIASTATQLLNFDETQRVLVLQNPPNDGFLNTITGFLGISATANIADLDIYNNPNTFAQTAFAVVRSGSVDSLLTLNLTNGSLTAAGVIGAPVVDIAVSINRTIPALQGNLAFGLTFSAGNSAFNFLKFDTKNPTFIRSAQVITGLKTGQSLTGLDMRPQDNRLYALGYRATDSVATIYTLNDTTAALSVFAGADSFKLALGTGQVAFDFNPVANRLRIIGATTRNNYRLNLTVNPITVTLDTALTYRTTDANAGKTPLVVTGAYTGSFNGATATQLYDIDATLGIFTNQNSANGGFLSTIGALGLTLDANDATIDVDIFSKPNPSVDSAFLAANVSGSTGFDNLYNLNIQTGATTLVGRIGQGIAVRNIAVQLAKLTILSVNDRLKTLDTRLFPNPAQSHVTVQFDNEKAGTVEIAVFNLSGQRLVQKNFTAAASFFQNNIDLSHLPSGTYFIRMSTQTATATRQFVKF